jgi:hypothetical protein
MNYCKNNHAQYTSMDVCLAVCKLIPLTAPTMMGTGGAGGAGGGGLGAGGLVIPASGVGGLSPLTASSTTAGSGGMAGAGGAGGSNDGPPKGDSIACRAYYAKYASEPSFCPLAGPQSPGACSASACDAYCNLEMGACPTNFASIEQCKQDCAGATTPIMIPAYTRPPDYSVDQTAGDTYGCRMYWLTQAAADSNVCKRSTYASDVCQPAAAANCDTCFAEASYSNSGACSDLYKQCVGDATGACGQCKQCVDNCKADPNPKACVTNTCISMNSAGCGEYFAVLNCAYCQQCNGTSMLCMMEQASIGYTCQ